MAIKYMQAREAYHLDCGECGAEFAVIVEFAPGFKDFTPVCPYCHAEIELEVTR